MANRRIKIIVISLIVLLAAGLGSWYFLFRSDPEADSDTTQIDDNSTPSIHIFSNIPENLSDLITNIADENNYEITDGSADIHIGSSEELSFTIYQFLVPTKPWSQLADTDPEYISEVSDPIDEYLVENIDQDYLDFNYSSVNGVVLKTLSELDSTVISVPINGISPFDKSWWGEQNYPLTIEVEVGCADKKTLEEFKDILKKSEEFVSLGYTTEYPDPKDFVEIIKTGTTVAGGPGWELCESTKGDDQYPILEVKDVLENADLTIISNESSFVDGCIQGAGTTAFCGKTKYLQNLLTAGVDVVSLTGNHMNDYGRDYFTDTLNFYSENDILYFASGTNSTQAWAPLSIETKAGKITLIGYNRMGPDGVIATESLTGTAYYTQKDFLNSLDLVPEDTDIIWLDTHLWPEYGTTPTTEQITLTQEAVDNGVDFVTGVSSHEIQSITFYEDTPIFYGLGNFWFDQMWSQETRTGIALRVYVYEGKIRNIEILPTKVYNYCQPRFLTGDEKTEVLEYLVEISEF
jgi:hypothetical protein